MGTPAPTTQASPSFGKLKRGDRNMAATAKVAKASGRGSKPGERRGGRVKGTPNKVTATLKDMARQYTSEALEGLVNVLRSADAPPAAKVSAASAILDRGYGKPSQVLAGDEEGGPIAVATTIELVGVMPDAYSAD